MLQKIANKYLSSTPHWRGSVLSANGGMPKANTCPTCGRPMNNGAPSGGQTTPNPQNPQNPNKSQGYQPPAGFEDWFKGYMEKNYPGNKPAPPQQPPQPKPQKPNSPNSVQPTPATLDMEEQWLRDASARWIDEHGHQAILNPYSQRIGEIEERKRRERLKKYREQDLWYKKWGL